MYHFFVAPEQIGEKEIMIEGSDVNHIGNVLRMHPGEQVMLCTGQDERDYCCKITEITEEYIRTEILHVERSEAELPSRFYLFQGLPKSDKLELIIQKAVDLGVFQVIPVMTKRAVVKLDAKKEEAKKKRWNAISESAAKQSKRMIIPEVTGVMRFREALEYAQHLDVRLIPYELAAGMDKTREIVSEIVPGQSVGIFVGPEGGFEDEEVELALKMGVSPITLGKRILRTETAGMALLSVLMFQLEGK